MHGHRALLWPAPSLSAARSAALRWRMQVPAALQTIFEKNLDLLLSIFNPEGHLDITFLDTTTRVGRDDKGNVFLVERCPPSI